MKAGLTGHPRAESIHCFQNESQEEFAFEYTGMAAVSALLH